MQFVQMCDVICELVILNVSTVFVLIVTDDGEVVITNQFWSMDRFSCSHIDRASFFDDLGWYPQLGLTVDTSVTPMVMFSIAVSGCDFIAKEPCRISGGVGNQGLCGREFQFE